MQLIVAAPKVRLRVPKTSWLKVSESLPKLASILAELLTVALVMETLSFPMPNDMASTLV